MEFASAAGAEERVLLDMACLSAASIDETFVGL